MSDNSEHTEVRAMHKWQLAKLYGVGERTFNSWLKPFFGKIGKQHGNKYTPDQVRKIFECLGEP